MTTLPLGVDLRALIASGPYAHVTTINSDGSPQVTVVWAGLDHDDLITVHLGRYRKVRNLERDPRFVVSMLGSATPGETLRPYAVLEGRATVEPRDDAWDLLNDLNKLYVGPSEFAAPRRPGVIVRYSIERVTGVGPWA